MPCAPRTRSTATSTHDTLQSARDEGHQDKAERRREPLRERDRHWRWPPSRPMAKLVPLNSATTARHTKTLGIDDTRTDANTHTTGATTNSVWAHTLHITHTMGQIQVHTTSDEESPTSSDAMHQAMLGAVRTPAQLRRLVGPRGRDRSPGTRLESQQLVQSHRPFAASFAAFARAGGVAPLQVS